MPVLTEFTIDFPCFTFCVYTESNCFSAAAIPFDTLLRTPLSTTPGLAVVSIAIVDVLVVVVVMVVVVEF